MATVARTKQDVDNMTRQERLWDSLNHAYGQQREASDRSFDKAYSQADRQALGRGMQRSSYNAQNLAGINNQKIKAQNDIWNNQIADYENRLGALEQEEAEAERWERSFNASREDAAWNKDFQQKQADTANQQWQLNFNAGREDAAWQKGMTEKQYADTRADTAWTQNFQQSQADLAADQWERQFAQGNSSDDQKLAASYVSAIIAAGNIPSDELLARAGLTRADAERMIKAASSGSTGGGPSPKETPTPNETPGDPNALFDAATLARLMGNQAKSFTDIFSGNNEAKQTDAIESAYKEAKANNFADLPVVNFNTYNGKPYAEDPSGYTARKKTDTTQKTGVILNTEEIKKRKKESESLVNKPHINI